MTTITSDMQCMVWDKPELTMVYALLWGVLLLSDDVICMVVCLASLSSADSAARLSCWLVLSSCSLASLSSADSAASLCAPSSVSDSSLAQPIFLLFSYFRRKASSFSSVLFEAVSLSAAADSAKKESISLVELIATKKYDSRK